MWPSFEDKLLYICRHGTCGDLILGVTHRCQSQWCDRKSADLFNLLVSQNCLVWKLHKAVSTRRSSMSKLPVGRIPHGFWLFVWKLPFCCGNALFRVETAHNDKAVILWKVTLLSHVKSALFQTGRTVAFGTNWEYWWPTMCTNCTWSIKCWGWKFSEAKLCVE